MMSMIYVSSLCISIYVACVYICEYICMVPCEACIYVYKHESVRCVYGGCVCDSTSRLNN